ncbi:MAG: rod-binding protein [Treponema sp.]|nr:rod-binding protein [Treponema sp.]
MDIGITGAEFFNSAYPISSSVEQGRSSLETGRFEDVLRRVQHTQNSAGAESVPAVRAANKTPIDKTDKLYQLCLELETFLVKNLLTSMRNTVQKSGLIEEGFAGKIYEDMLYDEYAKDFTKTAGFGLAEQAYLQLRSLG